METRIVALFPLCIDSLREQPGVLMRRRRDGKLWTQVLCDIESEGDQFFARPCATLPDVVPLISDNYFCRSCKSS